MEAARNEEGAMGERGRVCVGGMEQEEQGWVGGKSSRPHSSSSSVRAPRNVRILGLGLRKVRIQNVVGVCVNVQCWVGGLGVKVEAKGSTTEYSPQWQWQWQSRYLTPNEDGQCLFFFENLLIANYTR